jgi:hypothetical protein
MLETWRKVGEEEGLAGLEGLGAEADSAPRVSVPAPSVEE